MKTRTSRDTEVIPVITIDERIAALPSAESPVHDVETNRYNVTCARTRSQTLRMEPIRIATTEPERIFTPMANMIVKQDWFYYLIHRKEDGRFSYTVWQDEEHSNILANGIVPDEATAKIRVAEILFAAVIADG